MYMSFSLLLLFLLVLLYFQFSGFSWEGVGIGAAGSPDGILMGIGHVYRKGEATGTERLSRGKRHEGRRLSGPRAEYRKQEFGGWQKLAATLGA